MQNLQLRFLQPMPHFVENFASGAARLDSTRLGSARLDSDAPSRWEMEMTRQRVKVL